MGALGQVGDARVVEHHERPVPAALAPFVERVVGYRLDGFAPGTHVGMPAGSLTLVLPLGEPLVVSDAVSGRRALDAAVGGLMAGPTHIHHDGHQHGIQLALRPGAARALLGCRPAELAGTTFELADVLGARSDVLRERLEGARSWAERFGIVELALFDGLIDAPPPHPEVDRAWRLIGTRGGAVRVGEVASAVGWSTRRLQEQFVAELGLTPKAVARIRRFEQSVPLVASTSTSLADVAARCGWFDHAHMVRDWRVLAGVAPSRWRTEDVLATA